MGKKVTYKHTYRTMMILPDYLEPLLRIYAAFENVPKSEVIAGALEVTILNDPRIKDILETPSFSDLKSILIEAGKYPSKSQRD
mgnify:CR=1 FL=1